MRTLSHPLGPLGWYPRDEIEFVHMFTSILAPDISKAQVKQNFQIDKHCTIIILQQLEASLHDKENRMGSQGLRNCGSYTFLLYLDCSLTIPTA